MHLDSPRRPKPKGLAMTFDPSARQGFKSASLSDGDARAQPIDAICSQCDGCPWIARVNFEPKATMLPEVGCLVAMLSKPASNLASVHPTFGKRRLKR